ncbi:MAG: HU family DNA-binding protein [Butyricicoccus sp.]|nr:HU family DNA-binding protein [Butyricicoccus sp.]
MNRTEWIAETAQRTGLTKKDTERVLLAALEVIGDTLAAGEPVRLTGFGQFETRTRAARTCRGFSEDAPVQTVGEAVLPVFRPGIPLKEKVNKT